MCDEIVPACREDAKQAACLIAETDADLFRWYTDDDLDLWIKVSEHEWESDSGIYSHTMSHVIRREREVVGLLVAYSFPRSAGIKWTLENSRAQLGSARLSRIDLVRSTASFLFPKHPEDAFYVQNIAVSPSDRGRGLGKLLMNKAFELGRAEGCRTCHLDVDSSSTQAVRFYKKLGLRVEVRTELPNIPSLHAHFRMVIDL